MSREMPSFDTSPAELVERFDAVAARHPALPPDVVADDAAIDGWVTRALAFAAPPPKG